MRRPLLMDACVLIDFVRGGRFVLEATAKYVGPVHVIRPVVDEVREIENEDELVELGVMVIDPELIDAFAAAGVVGPTSFQDRLCALTAKRLGCTCVTNDKQLRKYCAREGVQPGGDCRFFWSCTSVAGFPPPMPSRLHGG